MDRPIGTALQQALDTAFVTDTSVHLGKLSDTALSLLHTQLIDNHDAHRDTAPPHMRDYFNAVKLELLCRFEYHGTTTAKRFETRTPVDNLKRISETVQVQGTCSLADLQRQYWRK